jgi:predicted Rossmann fold nucleotide-binding protein DprA/Smf involved in DNA uptake
MKVAVVGSRTFSNYKLMESSLNGIENIKEIISGGAVGADRLSEKYAKSRNLELVIFYPDHKKYRSPYHHRNRLIAERCDLLVAFWNGHSTGTKYTINYAKKIGKEVKIIKF